MSLYQPLCATLGEIRRMEAAGAKNCSTKCEHGNHAEMLGRKNARCFVIKTAGARHEWESLPHGAEKLIKRAGKHAVVKFADLVGTATVQSLEIFT